DVKVAATGAPDEAVNGRVPVQIVVSPGSVYYFDGVTVNGLTRLNPSFVTKRFTRLSGKTYSPDALDERFRTLMKTGLFNVLQIKPVPVDGHLLRLDISAEEAKSKEFGFWVGFDTYEGALAGVQVGDRDLFGTGRPLTASIEVSQRSYKGEILSIWLRAPWQAIANTYRARCALHTTFHVDRSCPRLMSWQISLPVVAYSGGFANLRPRSAVAPALFIRLQPAAATKRLPFRS